jgi:hypothetical protein
MEPKRYTTERGVTIRVVPIPLLLDEVRRSAPMPEPPTYTEKLAGGATQEVEITEGDAETWAREDPETWAEHAERWAAYVQERDAAQQVVNDRIWQAILRRAIRVDMPEDDGWVYDHEAMGLAVPEDPRERRIHYVRTEVVGGMPDILKITAMANGADLSEEALASAEASFRDSLARSLTGGLADQAGSMAPGNEGGPDADGKGMGPAAQ